jgi:epoxyqueuosine reductase
MLAKKIREVADGTVWTRCFVDTAPLLEKYYAARAGLGWIGKNGLLVNRELGTWVVLGEIVTGLELEYDTPVEEGCGDCELCTRACPTSAFRWAGQLDARRCLSYFTVEGKGELIGGITEYIGDRIFGCDVCQEVCPYNRKAAETRLEEFQPKWCAVSLERLAGMGEEEFQREFGGSCLERVGLVRLQEVGRVCKGNLLNRQE